MSADPPALPKPGFRRAVCKRKFIKHLPYTQVSVFFFVNYQLKIIKPDEIYFRNDTSGILKKVLYI